MRRLQLTVVVAVVGTLAGAAQAAIWNQPASSATPYDWNVDGNWTSPAAFPSGQDAQANIDIDITGSSTLTIQLRQDITLGTLVLGDTGSGTDRPVTITNFTGETFGLTFDVASGTAALSTVGSASNTISAAVTLNDSLVLDNASQLTLGGAVTGSGGITKNGAGVLVLSMGSNAFNGDFTLNAGAARGGNNVAVFGNGRVILNGGTIGHTQSNGSNLPNKVTVGGSFTLGTQNNAHIRFTNTADDAFVLNTAAPTITLATTSSTKVSDIQGPISEAASGHGLSLVGAATNGTDSRIIFSGAKSNTYTGTTTVESAYLSLNKSGAAVAIPGNLDVGGHATKNAEVVLAGTSTDLIANTATVNVLSRGALNMNGKSDTVAAVNVQAGGTLKGAGTLTAPVLVTGGRVVPGGSPGTLNIQGDLSLDGTSILDYELSGTDTTVGSNVNDLIAGVNALALNGTLNVAEIVPGSFLSASVGNTWRLINYSGTLSGSGLALGTMPTLSPGLEFVLDTGVAGQVNLRVGVIPEPATLALLALGAGFMLPRRRR